ncbi:glycoside hydrolase family 19 protein, partial [Flectobacillus roseus]|uniref:glycoside hydrolase family 19 protein n=1 Tax=Flectobacillus roseus TaxID=502259 RepID=UPI00363A16E3
KIDIQDTEAKEVKIDAVWKYLGGKAPEHQATFPITGEQLHDIFLFSGTSQERCDEVASIINKYSDEYGIDNAEKMSHFIGQIGAESNLNNLKEEYRYKKDRIKEVFGKVKYCDLFVGYESDLDECNGDKPASCIPQLTEITSNMVIKDKYKGSIKLFDYVYSCRMGNGAPNSGDGGRFRGRAFLHLTGRDKYEILQAKWNSTFPNDKKDFLCDSDACEATRELLINDLDFAMRSSLAFWKSVNANTIATIVDDKSIKEVSKKINGGLNGIETRIELTKKAYNTIK